MKSFAIGGFALTVALLGGCSSAPSRAGMNPDVEYVERAPRVVYAPPAAASTAPTSATTTAVIAPPGTTVVQGPSSTTTGSRGETIIVPGHGVAGTTQIPATAGTVVAAPGTTVVPGPATTTVIPGAVVSPPVPQMLRADEIHTHRVRANTIYANRIEANEIVGVIHQDKSLKVDDIKGDIKAPEVVASVIYADEIKAHSVIADNIYVKNLRRR